MRHFGGMGSGAISSRIHSEDILKFAIVLLEHAFKLFQATTELRVGRNYGAEPDKYLDDSN
jgi:hypothetical protein